MHASLCCHLWSFGLDALSAHRTILILLGFIIFGGIVLIIIIILQLVTSFLGNMFDEYDQDLIIDFDIHKIDLEVQMTKLNIGCCIISSFQMLLYVIWKSWIYDNILALIFCIHIYPITFWNSSKPTSDYLSSLVKMECLCNSLLNYINIDIN